MGEAMAIEVGAREKNYLHRALHELLCGGGRGAMGI